MDEEKEYEKLPLRKKIWVSFLGGHVTLKDDRVLFWCKEHNRPCFGIRHGYGHAGEQGAYIRHQT